MDENQYLQNVLSKQNITLIKNRFGFAYYKSTYYLISARRFLLQTALIFVFQFLIIMNIQFTSVVFPIYPPIGIAFTLFYLLGNSAFVGLFLAGFSGYLLKGFPAPILFLYLTADLLGGYLGNLLSLRCFSTDIKPFAKWQEIIQFVKNNVFISCLVSSLLRLFAVIIFMRNEFGPLSENALTIRQICFNFIDLWLADINAFLVFPGFLLSWAYISFSREKPYPKTFPKIISIVTIIFIALSVLFMKNWNFIYFIILVMISSVIISKFCGYLIATTLSFIVSTIYLTFFMIHTPQFIQAYGLGLFTFVPILLFIYASCVLYLGHKGRCRV